MITVAGPTELKGKYNGGGGEKKKMHVTMSTRGSQSLSQAQKWLSWRTLTCHNRARRMVFNNTCVFPVMTPHPHVVYIHV